MQRRWVLVVLGLLLSACARSAAGTGPSPSGSVGGTITIGPQDDGKTITLKAGDVLVFSSTSSPSPSALAWRLVSYPKSLISLISSSSTPPFRFRALHPGTGKLELSQGPSCGSPGPLAAQCPVSGSMDQGAGFLSRLITFELNVVARG